MKPVFKIDTSAFNKMCRDLSRMTGNEQKTVLEYEVGKVLEGAIRNTPAANITRLREELGGGEFSYQPPDLYTPQTSAGLKARGRAKTSDQGKLLYYLKNRYPDSLWNAIATARKTSLDAKIHARGLAKQSWLRIADLLGIKVSAPSFVRLATASTGKSYAEDYATSLHLNAGKIGIFIENSQTTINKIGGARALQRAINGRVGYFTQNMKRSVFNSVAAVAKKYSGVRIN